MLQMSRAGSDFFPQPLQLQVPLAASEFDERFLPPSEGVDQLGTLSVNGALDLSTALLFGPTKVSMRSTLSVTSNQSARWCGRPESNGWRCLARKISIEKETELCSGRFIFFCCCPVTIQQKVDADLGTYVNLFGGTFKPLNNFGGALGLLR